MKPSSAGKHTVCVKLIERNNEDSTSNYFQESLLKLRIIGKLLNVSTIILLPNKTPFPFTAVDSSQAKRLRVNSGSADTVVNPPGNELPEGMPEVVGKGFASIPAPPIKSPFILRRTTTTGGVRTRAGAKRAVAARATMVTQGSVSLFQSVCLNTVDMWIATLRYLLFMTL